MLRSDSGAGGKFFEWLGEVGATKENSYFFAPLSYRWLFFLLPAMWYGGVFLSPRVMV